MAINLYRMPQTNLFFNYDPTDSQDPAVHARFCFFHVPSTTRTIITLEYTQTVPGTYAFIPANQAGSLQGLESFLARSVAPEGHFLIWTNSDWQTQSASILILNASTYGPLTLNFLDFDAVSDGSSSRGRLYLDIPAGIGVKLDGDGFQLSGKDLNLAVEVGSVTYSLPVQDGVELGVKTGQRCATVTGRLSVKDSARLIAELTPQVKYRWEERHANWTYSVSSRIFSKQADRHQNVFIKFGLNKFSAGRDFSRLDLFVEEEDGKSVMASELTDTYGHTLDLIPSSSAAIYFEEEDSGIHASMMGKFKVAAGNNAVRANAGGSTREIMAGTSGTEFFQLGKADGIEFFPSRPAFLIYGSLDHEPNIDAKFLTAWMAPCKTDGFAALDAPGYGFVAQPQDQPLFGRRDMGPVTQEVHPSAVFFDRVPINVASADCLPFFPFRGIERGILENAQSLDRDVLGPVRSRLAFNSAASVRSKRLNIMNNPGNWITTPQGLLVQVDSKNNWQRIQIGESSKNNVGPWQLIIERPENAERWGLQEALSQSDVFVVMTKPPAQSLPSEPAFGKITLSVNINGWGMSASFNETAKMEFAADSVDAGFEPVLIFKLSHAPLRDCLADIRRWSLARTFNGDPDGAMKNAMAALDNLEKLSNGFSPLINSSVPEQDRKIPGELIFHYRQVYDKIADPSWTGVVIFNANAPFDDVPPAVSVVTQDESAKQKSFGIPVLGIDVNRVVPDAKNNMVLEKTSAFGAIHYHKVESLPEAGEFEFKLRSLNAVFNNTELRIFVASMQLRLSNFFGSESAPGSGSDSRVLNIKGRYASKLAIGEESQYIFSAIGSRRMQFEGNEFLSSLTSTRIDVTSRVVDSLASPRVIESRFGIWGELAFAPKFSSITGIEKIGYENAALVMTGDRFRIDVGQLRVDFRKDTGGTSNGSGLLANFPFQLSALRWSGGSGPEISLPSIGFTSLTLPAFPQLSANDFDFGLELDLNLGSMGKLFEGADFLKAKILIGWHDFSRKDSAGHKLTSFCAGFRFEGGSGPLDIGINGVLRLTARDVNLKTYDNPSGIGIGLINPQLEVMGYKIPDNPKDTLVAFYPTGGKGIGWAWARDGATVGPVELSYFALGQKMMLVKDDFFGPDASLLSIVDHSKDLLRPSTNDENIATLPNVAELYSEKAGWGVIAKGSIYNFQFRFVFLDGIDRYGLGMNIPMLADIDVLYRRISDDIGVFSAEITTAKRTFEMGAATVTLPVLGFDAFTNGNWSLNIGYHGNDFSRGTTVQILPFLGSGGIRFGKLDWRSSYVLNSPETTPKRRELLKKLALDPVIEISMSARVGIGKEFREGAFFAIVTLSIYAIFEGALGTPQDPKFPIDTSRRYIKISGSVGILLEILGAVNFGIISAAVAIRFWVETGITFETWAPVIIHAEAGVSVFVRFVIARFSIFGRNIEIAIDFQFATRVRVKQKITDSFDGNMPDQYRKYQDFSIADRSLSMLVDAQQPLQWVNHPLEQPKREVDVTVTMEPMISGQGLVLLPMLVASQADEKIDGIEQFCADLFVWALRLSKGMTPGDQNPQQIKFGDLEVLEKRLRAPKRTSLARWGSQPLNYPVLEAFFESRLRLELKSRDSFFQAQKQKMQINKLKEPETPQGVLLPWFSELAVWGSFDEGAEICLRDFRETHQTDVDENWETALTDLLFESMPVYDPEAGEDTKQKMLEMGGYFNTTGAKAALDAVTEDWAAALVQGMAQRSLQVARSLLGSAEPSGDTDIELTKLLDALQKPGGQGSPCAQVAQHASTFLHHGLRVPATAPQPSQALTEFLRTEITLAELQAAGNECELAFKPRKVFANSWIKGVSTIRKFNVNEAVSALKEADQSLGQSKIKLTVSLDDAALDAMAPRRFVCDTLVPLGVAGSAITSLYMAPVPEALFSLAQRTPGLNVETVLEDKTDLNKTKACVARWMVKIDVRLAALSTGTRKSLAGARAVYSITAVDPRIRSLLIKMINEGGTGSWGATRLVFAAPKNADGPAFMMLENRQAFFYVSNLSKEAAPPQELVHMAGEKVAVPTLAHLSDSSSLARVLWMASVVNSPGFSLAFEDNDPIRHLFEEAASASVSIMFALPPSSGFESMIDGILLEAGTVESGIDGKLLEAGTVESGWTACFKTPEVRELRSSAPDGQVALLVDRKNPLHGIHEILDDKDADGPYLAARYELVDYWTKKGAKSTGGSVPLTLARHSVVPVRVYIEEQKKQDAEIKAEPILWQHRLLIPLTEIAKRTTLGHDMAPHVGNPSNPYEFVGTNVSELIEIGLRDGAGHALAEGSYEVSWAKADIIDECKLLYHDAVLALDELPGVTASWTAIADDQGAPAFAIKMSWAAKDLMGGEDTSKNMQMLRRKALKEQYQRFVHMVEARDFTAILKVKIADLVVGKLDAKVDVLSWLKQILNELTGQRDKESDCRLLIVQIMSEHLPSATPAPVQLEVEMNFDRTAALCDSRLNNVDIQSSQTLIGPGKVESAADWMALAKQVSKAFGGKFSVLRHVGGRIPGQARVPGQASRGVGSAVWLIRSAMLPASALRASAASFYAPSPLAKTFMSGSVEVDMPDGQKELVESQDMDLNAVAARASLVLESMLHASCGETLCRLAPSPYPDLMLAKRDMADAMAKRLAAIVHGQPEASASAVEKFKNVCRGDTSIGFSPVALVSVTLDNEPQNKTFISGTLNIVPKVRNVAEKEKPSAVAISRVRLALGSNGPQGSFDFLLRWVDPGSDPVAAINGEMKFKPQYIEVQGDKGPDNYIPTEWYEIIWSDDPAHGRDLSVAPVSGNEWNIPLPLRMIPPSPTILRHDGEQAELTPAPGMSLDLFVAAARSWRYGLSLMVPSMDHDTAKVTIRFSDQFMVSSKAMNPLFAALVTFKRHELWIEKLVEQLSQGGAGASLVDLSSKVAFAVRIFRTVSSSLDFMQPPSLQAMEDKDLRVVELHTVVKSLSVLWKVTPDQYKNTVACHLLELPNDGTREEVTIPADIIDKPGGVATYSTSASNVLPAFKGMAGLSPRRVDMDSLDVLLQGKVESSVIARRNDQLLGSGITISENFIFETARVQTADPLVPHVHHGEVYDISASDSVVQSMSHWIKQLEKALFHDAERKNFSFDISPQFKLLLVQDNSTDSAIHFLYPLPSLKAVSAEDKNWVDNFSGLLLQSINNLNADAKAHGQLLLNVQVFAKFGAESKRPILSLTGLYLPLAKVSVDAAIAKLFAQENSVKMSLPNPIAVNRVAEFVYTQTRWLSGKEDQLSHLRDELARWAFSADLDLLATSEPLAIDELEIDAGRIAWVHSMAAASKAVKMSPRETKYGVLRIGPADPSGERPAPDVQHWSMALQSANIECVAGPFIKMHGLVQEQSSQEQFLWGLTLP